VSIWPSDLWLICISVSHWFDCLSTLRSLVGRCRICVNKIKTVGLSQRSCIWYVLLLSVRKIWELPCWTHCYLLPLLCCSLSVFDQLCTRSLNFVHRFLSHDSDCVKLISHYCINYGRSNSCIGKNVMFCLHQYKCSVEKVFFGQMNNIIESHFIRSTRTLCMLH